MPPIIRRRRRRRRAGVPKTRTLSSVARAAAAGGPGRRRVGGVGRRSTSTPRSRRAAATAVTPAVRKHAALLCVLAKSKNPRLATKILSASKNDPSLLKAVSECAYNVLRGRARVGPASLAKLRRHRNKLRLLTDPSASVKSKNALLMKGGAIGFIGPLLASVLPMILGSIIKK